MLVLLCDRDTLFCLAFDIQVTDSRFRWRFCIELKFCCVLLVLTSLSSEKRTGCERNQDLQFHSHILSPSLSLSLSPSHSLSHSLCSFLLTCESTLQTKKRRKKGVLLRKCPENGSKKSRKGFKRERERERKGLSFSSSSYCVHESSFCY